MQRMVYRVTLHRNGEEIHRSVAYAPKSAREASEAAVRAVARREVQTYTGGPHHRVEGTYTRTWTGDRSGTLIVATTQRMP